MAHRAATVDRHARNQNRGRSYRESEFLQHLLGQSTELPLEELDVVPDGSGRDLGDLLEFISPSAPASRSDRLDGRTRIAQGIM
jgi:hypothetical protein